MAGEPTAELCVRASGPGDAAHAPAAVRLLAASAEEYDIATREESFLAPKLEGGRAALALAAQELVGFGYWSEWGGGAFVSHSGLVVHRDRRGAGLGRRLKELLLQGSQARFPGAVTMSLTSSPQVRALNLSLGFRPCRFDELTSDPAFWAGCEACRNYARIRSEGQICCCEPMLREPEGPA